jgi:hypothetical protein
MSYIGSTPTTQGFIPAIDFFSGNGATVAFTLSRPVASVAQVQATIENVPQNPGTAFTVSGNTITFDGAPPSGTNNIYVYYTSPITQVIAPSQGTVFPSTLSTGGPFWSTAGRVGIGTTSPASTLHLSSTLPILTFTDTDDSATTRVYQDNANFVIEVDGTDTKASSSLRFQVDNTVRMTIDSSGRVTTPSQPAFRARRATNWTKTGAGTEAVPFDTAITNIGNNYNTSNYRFTAPVAGMYHFETTVGTNSGGSTMSYYGVIFTVNNSTVLDGWSRQETGGYIVDTKSISIYLNQNDFVIVVLEAQATITTTVNQTNFSGYLIG